MESPALENLFNSCYKNIYNQSLENTQHSSTEKFQLNLQSGFWPFNLLYNYSLLLFPKLSKLILAQQQQEIANVCFLFEMNLSRFQLDTHHLLQNYHDALIDTIILNMFPIGYFQKLPSDNNSRDSILFFLDNELNTTKSDTKIVWEFICYIPPHFNCPNSMKTSTFSRSKDTFMQSIQNKLLSKTNPQFIPIVYQHSAISQQIVSLQVPNSTKDEYFEKNWTIGDIPLLLTQRKNGENRFALDFADSCLSIQQIELKQFQSSLSKGMVPKLSSDKYSQTSYSLGEKNHVVIIQNTEIDYECICSQARTYLVNPTAHQIEVLEYLIYLRGWISAHLYQHDTIQSAIKAIQSKIKTDGKESLLEHMNQFILIPNVMSSIFISNASAAQISLQKELLTTMQLQALFYEGEDEDYICYTLSQNILIHLCYKTDTYCIVLCDTYMSKVKAVITPIKRPCDYIFPKSRLSVSEYKQSTSLSKLPNDIHNYLVLFFGIQEFVSYYCTCKALHGLFVKQVNPTQQMIWKEFVLRYFFDNSLKNSFGFTKHRFNSQEEPNQDTTAEYEYDKMAVKQEMEKFQQVDWRQYFISKQKLIIQFQSIQSKHCIVCGNGEESVFEKLLQISGINRFKSLFSNKKQTWNGYLKGLTNSCSIDVKLKQVVILQKRKPTFFGDRYYHSSVHYVVYALDVTNFETYFKRIYRQFHDTLFPFYQSYLRILVVLVNYDNSKKFYPYNSSDVSFRTQASKNISTATTVMEVLRLDQIGRCSFYMGCKASICVLDDFMKEFKKLI